MLLAVGTHALGFLYMCHDWKKYHQSQLGKEKSAVLWFMMQQNNFLMHVFALKIDNFEKPKKICKFHKLKHQNIAQYCPICIIQDFWCIICQKIAQNSGINKKKKKPSFRKPCSVIRSVHGFLEQRISLYFMWHSHHV